MASVACLAGWVLAERTAVEPVLPLYLFRNRMFVLGSCIGFVVSFVTFCLTTYLPLYLQVAKGAGSTNSGLKLLPMMAGLVITSTVTGLLISRWGHKRTAAVPCQERNPGIPACLIRPSGRRYWVTLLADAIPASAGIVGAIPTTEAGGSVIRRRRPVYTAVSAASSIPLGTRRPGIPRVTCTRPWTLHSHNAMLVSQGAGEAHESLVAVIVTQHHGTLEGILETSG